MSIFEPNNSGTVAFTNGSTAIVGAGTTFTSYRAGSVISIPGLGSMQLAADPTSDTAAVGQVAWQGADTGAKPFQYEPRNEQATFSQKLTALLNELSNGNLQAEATIDGAGGNWLSYFTGAGTKARTALTAFARTLLGGADAAAARETLGAQVAGNYQPAGNYQSALGYTPVNKAGDSMSGDLSVAGTLASQGSMSGLTYALTLAGPNIIIAAGFPWVAQNFSGLIIANNLNSGGVAIYVAGGGSISLVASSTTHETTAGYAPDQSGYAIFNAAGAAREFRFMLIRVRTGG